MMPPVYDLLSNDAAVAALVADRIFRHGRAPQDVVKPYITWSVVGGHAENYLAERPGIDEDLAQIDCWAASATECKALMIAVVAALELHGMQQGTPQDDFENDTQLYRYMVQFDFWTHR